MTQLPRFQEEYSAKIPALVVLNNLGWTFLSPDQALIARDNKPSEVVLTTVLYEVLRKRRFIYAGKEYPLSDKSIDAIVAEITTPALNEGLTKANERIYNHILYGITVTEFVGGKKINPTIPLIDWHDIKNNSFLFTEEYSVLGAGGAQTRCPDIVCFVNGLPLAVIEAKRPDGKKGPTIEEGISQHLRNQRLGEIPQLFAYSQLLLSINGVDGLYATQGTDKKFWATWRDEDIDENQFNQIKNLALTPQQIDGFFNHRRAIDRAWFEKLISQGQLAVTGQDKLLIGLLSPQRLLDITRYFMLFDKKAGKIVARYQQFFGIQRLIERINSSRPDGGREGGVIWHTTGSGKSLTMVFLSRALILHDSLKQCRIVVVTDRVDLERQLSNTFHSGGEFSGKTEFSNAKATSGRRLAEQISKGTERVIFSLIQKFNTAAKLPQCKNLSRDIVVLVDEGHRSQGGENYIRMKQALPNAAFIAFTGTPLLKEDKTTNKFGSIIHAYTMQRAVEDKMVTPLLYEERRPELMVNDRAIDSWFERITEELSEDQRADLKKKYAKKGEIYRSENRIELVALDIAHHFVKNIDEGLKGQIACDSKLSAIRYKKYLDEVGLFESAVVMSPPDTREGNVEVDESKIPEVTKWWKDNVGNQDEREYTRQVIERFANDEDLKIIIVVDKLLTGFDEPRNTVLYIDKQLKEHNLIQAIARVNRLHEKKKFGLLIDYRGILKELDTTIAKYQDLASRTQQGYDITDLDGLYHQMSSEYKRLPLLYDALWQIFKEVKNKGDFEQLRQVLIPKIQEVDGDLVDTNLKVREDFYDALSEFANCLKVALQSDSFFDDKSITDAQRTHYKETLKQFTSLRQIAKLDAGEIIIYDKYAELVKKLMDKHVVGVQIKEPEGVYEVGKMGHQERPEEWNEEKTRNETDIIKTRIAKMIEQDLRDDPYAQETFSELLKIAIKEADELFEHPLKQYLLFQEFEHDVLNRKLKEIPADFSDNHHAQAYYGVFKLQLPVSFATLTEEEQKKWIDLAFTADELINISIAEHSLNQQNTEADIRKKLLPIIFKACKELGFGMEHAKNIIEQIIQIVRVGLISI
ncbi:type I restriction endonuclease subunit R [Legionella londiniensis]|uniref:type I restriction endonuclease subunit R n=1 Tax=Legionella londiniensis TaxID=45068 RepID=UPI00399D1AA6